MRPGGRREEPQTDGFSVQGAVQGGAAGSRTRQPGGGGGSPQTGPTNQGGGSVRSQESDHSRGSSGGNVQSGSTREPGESTHPRSEKAGTQTTGGSDSGDSGSGGYENDYTDPNTGIQVVSPEGQAPGETPGLPADDPMTGGGGRGSDDIRGRLTKELPRGVTQQDIDLVGPAVGTKTGPDDKERPDLGSGASSEISHYGGDLGDDLPYSLSSGGSIDRNIGQELLRKLRPINPGGPDPEK